MKHVWITKYALTKGIIKTFGTINKCESDYVKVFWPDAWPDGYRFFRRSEVAWSQEAALKKARKLRSKKLAFLERQVKKLEEMTWNWITFEKEQERIEKLEDSE